jgi:hypothetical protein
MKQPFEALQDGIGRVARAPAVLIGVWIAIVAISLPPTLVMGSAIHHDLGASLEAESAASGVNHDWMVEFNQRGRVAGPLDPSVIGFAAVLDNFSAFFDGEAGPLLVTLTAALLLVLWIFLAGGILDRYARMRPVSSYGFFSACGVFFFRFLRLALFAGLAYWLLFGLLHGWLFDDLYQQLTSDVTVERSAFVLRVSFYLVFGALLAAVNLLFDYAKVRAVVEDRRSMVFALAAAARFLLRHARAAIPLYLVNLSLAGLVIVAYALVAPGAGSAGVGMWMAFAIGQLYVLGRLWAKLTGWASAAALFQRRLAHAGYIMKAAPRWPDSPNVEAVRQASANL